MSVGSLLRERREALSLELSDVSEYLRIRLSFLEAIENEDFKDLPGGTYAIGFVKSYAKTLGLNHEAVADAFRQEQAEAARKAPLKVRSPLTDARIPTTGIVVLAGGLLLAIWAGWSYFDHRPTVHADIVPELPDRLKAEAVEPKAAAPVPTSAAVPQPVQPAIAAAASGPDQLPPVTQAPASMPPATSSTDNEPDEAENDTDMTSQGPNMRTAPEPQDTAGTVYGAPAASGQIVIHALDDSWIQVRDGNRTVVYTGILHRGDVYRAPAGQGYSFVTGNAGGISLDGTTPLGSTGQVLHDVPLDVRTAKHP